jgi:hypothetical protein
VQPLQKTSIKLCRKVDLLLHQLHQFRFFVCTFSLISFFILFHCFLIHLLSFSDTLFLSRCSHPSVFCFLSLVFRSFSYFITFSFFLPPFLYSFFIYSFRLSSFSHFVIFLLSSVSSSCILFFYSFLCFFLSLFPFCPDFVLFHSSFPLVFIYFLLPSSPNYSLLFLICHPFYPASFYIFVFKSPLLNLS